MVKIFPIMTLENGKVVRADPSRSQDAMNESDAKDQADPPPERHAPQASQEANRHGASRGDTRSTATLSLREQEWARPAFQSSDAVRTDAFPEGMSPGEPRRESSGIISSSATIFATNHELQELQEMLAKQHGRSPATSTGPLAQSASQVTPHDALHHDTMHLMENTGAFALSPLIAAASARMVTVPEAVEEEEVGASEKRVVEEKATTAKPVAPGPKSAARSMLARIRRINPGLPLMVLSAFAAAVMALSAKLLATLPSRYPAFEIMFLRSFVFIAATTPWMFAHTPQPLHNLADMTFGPRGMRKLVLLRSTFGVLTAASYYMAFQYLSVGEATVISFTTPIFVGIAARVVLKERWELLDGCATLISLLGILIITQPHLFDWLFPASTISASTSRLLRQDLVGSGPTAVLAAVLPPDLTPEVLLASGSRSADGSQFGQGTSTSSTTTQITPSQHMLGIGLSLFSAAMGAGGYVSLRKLKTVHTWRIMHAFAVFTFASAPLGSWVVDGSPAMVMATVPSTAYELTLLGPMLALAALVSQFAVATALKYEAPSKCSTVSSLQIVFAFALDYFVRGTAPRRTDYVGGAIILVSIGAVGFGKWRHEQREREAKARMAAIAAPTSMTLDSRARAPTLETKGRRSSALKLFQYAGHH